MSLLSKSIFLLLIANITLNASENRSNNNILQYYSNVLQHDNHNNNVLQYYGNNPQPFMANNFYYPMPIGNYYFPSPYVWNPMTNQFHRIIYYPVYMPNMSNNLPGPILNNSLNNINNSNNNLHSIKNLNNSNNQNNSSNNLHSINNLHNINNQNNNIVNLNNSISNKALLSNQSNNSLNAKNVHINKNGEHYEQNEDSDVSNNSKGQSKGSNNESEESEHEDSHEQQEYSDQNENYEQQKYSDIKENKEQSDDNWYENSEYSNQEQNEDSKENSKSSYNSSYNKNIINNNSKDNNISEKYSSGTYSYDMEFDSSNSSDSNKQIYIKNLLRQAKESLSKQKGIDYNNKNIINLKKQDNNKEVIKNYDGQMEINNNTKKIKKIRRPKENDEENIKISNKQDIKSNNEEVIKDLNEQENNNKILGSKTFDINEILYKINQITKKRIIPDIYLILNNVQRAMEQLSRNDVPQYTFDRYIEEWAKTELLKKMESNNKIIKEIEKANVNKSKLSENKNNNKLEELNENEIQEEISKINKEQKTLKYKIKEVDKNINKINLYYYSGINSSKRRLVGVLKNHNTPCIFMDPTANTIEDLLLKGSNNIFDEIGISRDRYNLIDGIKEKPLYGDIYEIVKMTYDKKSNTISKDYREQIYDIIKYNLINPCINDFFQTFSETYYDRERWISKIRPSSKRYNEFFLTIIDTKTRNILKLKLNIKKSNNEYIYTNPDVLLSNIIDKNDRYFCKNDNRMENSKIIIELNSFYRDTLCNIYKYEADQENYNKKQYYNQYNYYY